MNSGWRASARRICCEALLPGIHSRRPWDTLATTSSRALLTAGLFQFVTYACFFNLTPLYPEVASDLGVDAGALGGLVGIGGIVSLLAQVPGGSGGDRWGRRPFFAVALGLLLLSQLARWQATTPTVLLAAQVLGGAAQGVATVNAWALVADSAATAPAKGRGGQGQAFGILNASLALGLVTGYLFAGAVGSQLGWRLMSLASAALPLLVVPALGWIPWRGTRLAMVRPGLAVVLRSIVQPQRLALTAMAALTLGAGQGALYLLPFGAQQRDLGPLTAAVLLVPYVVGSVIAGPLGGRLSDQFGSRPVILALLAIGVCACFGLIWVGADSPGLVVCFVLIGASVNGALPLLAVRIISLGDSAKVGVGTIIAGLRMGQSSGTFLGPAIAGLVLAHVGLDAGWLAQAACLAVSLALLELAPGRQQPLTARSAPAR
ncbi:MAG: MFS transporter [Chloroflexi bacterium]|nr:MFS transporter [Chloroflexota bacterium]